MLTVHTFTFNPVQENTYVVYNEKGACCIIDPGCYFASEEQQLASFIEANGLQPVLLLNTHCHLDHIFGNRYVQQKWGLELHLHRAELPVLERGPASGQLWQLPFVNYDGPMHYLDEGDSVRIGDDELQVLFTPGHSPGHISFYSPTQRFLLSGDVLFNGSVGRTDLPGGDFAILEESIRTKLYTLPEDVIVYPGHGDTTTIGDERRDNPFVKMQ
ncbi:MBL fold metallo-hydrolase [Flaviaesturariibacter aridisoli]|uniref:MBL fold metallo-hydrolase n=1 Tax=Flaviaesturariibacter aridisoli TaxID=2545761 RepID=A0A4R4E3X2_9BACT|nr:MBL fold metallo-hydrolase [Flaviaesturariibacter aridisoli]TCZ73533.1 MBL fold metallo-hydrolase [Flaviaesturariibacter aridisoli]